MDVATTNSPDVRRNTRPEWCPAAATAAAAARGMSVWRREGTSASSCGGGGGSDNASPPPPSPAGGAPPPPPSPASAVDAKLTAPAARAGHAGAASSANDGEDAANGYPTGPPRRRPPRTWSLAARRWRRSPPAAHTPFRHTRQRASRWTCARGPQASHTPSAPPPLAGVGAAGAAGRRDRRARRPRLLPPPFHLHPPQRRQFRPHVLHKPPDRARHVPKSGGTLALALTVQPPVDAPSACAATVVGRLQAAEAARLIATVSLHVVRHTRQGVEGRSPVPRSMVAAAASAGPSGGGRGGGVGRTLRRQQQQRLRDGGAAVPDPDHLGRVARAGADASLDG